MADASRLVRAMQKANAPKENEIVDIVTGTVTSTSPLKIKVDKLELTQSFLILSPMCKNKTVNITIDDTTHAVTIWRGLQKGDQVYMIRCCQGQKYYVLQRKEGV